MEDSVKLNHERWYSNLPDDISEKNIEFLEAFLKNRITVPDAAWPGE